MFNNFIYFIIALLIYSTHQPSEISNFTAGESLTLFCSLMLLFFLLNRIQFYRLEKRISKESRGAPGYSRYFDHKFNSIVTRHFIFALALFAVDIHVLNLTAFFSGIAFFAAMPTLQALFFLGLFVARFVIVWDCAHKSYEKLYAAGLSKRSYILSNLSFSVPVLMPWLLLSGVADIINALPFETPKKMLASPAGEIAYFLFFLLGLAIAGPLLIQKFWRCRPLESGYMRSRIESLCRRAELAYANILYWPIFGGKMITAGVMGLIRQFRYILVTEALLQVLNIEEIEAVIAHEIGHIKKKHLLFYLFFMVGFLIFFYTVFDLIFYVVVYSELLLRFISRSAMDHISMSPNIFSLILILMFLLYFRYLFGYFMRNFERQADIYVYSLFENAEPLISTFEKITVNSGQPPEKPNWHHFSITERVEYLKKCEADKDWITRHERKVNRSLAAYLAGLLLIVGAGYYSDFAEIGKKTGLGLLIRTVEREIEVNPGNAELYSILGDIFYDTGDDAKAAEAYKTFLEISPDDVRILNNLAWLYATCGNRNLRNPERAIVLALKAAELTDAPYILDTLAESYYVNGQFDAAVSAEKRALEQIKDGDRSYYERQLKKFAEAAGRKSER
jgi:Zn-dependent protease with chaperone function